MVAVCSSHDDIIMMRRREIDSVVMIAVGASMKLLLQSCERILNVGE
jgi:hypothetical protein